MELLCKAMLHAAEIIARANGYIMVEQEERFLHKDTFWGNVMVAHEYAKRHDYKNCCPTSTSSLSTLSLRRTLTRTSPSRRLNWKCTLAIQESRCIATMVLGRSACHIIQRHTGSPRHRYGENLVSLGQSCSRNT